jgi:hypothetical protein
MKKQNPKQLSKQANTGITNSATKPSRQSIFKKKLKTLVYTDAEIERISNLDSPSEGNKIIHAENASSEGNLVVTVTYNIDMFK